jgi:hypothetical protein
MLKIKNLRGECEHCGEPIEFHAEHTGDVADCPHCGRSTELRLPLPPDENPLRRKIITLIIVAIVILLAALVATNIAFKRAKRLQEKRQQNSALEVTPTSNFAKLQQLSLTFRDS